MTKQQIIDAFIKAIDQLPDDHAIDGIGVTYALVIQVNADTKCVTAELRPFVECE